MAMCPTLKALMELELRLFKDSSPNAEDKSHKDWENALTKLRVLYTGPLQDPNAMPKLD